MKLDSKLGIIRWLPQQVSFLPSWHHWIQWTYIDRIWITWQVLQCISRAWFVTALLLRHKTEFFDDKALHTFMSLTKEKSLCNIQSWQKSILDELQVAWNTDPEFEGNYITDYLQNEFTNDTSWTNTSWTDKYTTAMYSPSPSISTSRNEFQSLPDYIYKMAKTCDLHYLAIQRGESYYNMGHGMRCLAFSFLQRILDLSYWQTILHMMSWRVVLLGWKTVQEAREYYGRSRKWT